MMPTTHAQTTLNLTRRLRRLRRTDALRALVRETRLDPAGFMLPLFICPGEGVRREVGSMPGVFNLSVDEAVREATAAQAEGVTSVLLFGVIDPDQKDDVGSTSYDPEGPVQAAVRALKRELPGLLVATDVCLCEYTDHGHCGILVEDVIANDPTVDQLVRAAVSHAAAGADIVAPSDMMDGRVGAIRHALDTRGFESVAIMSYSAKYCSGFYGPFRDAAASAPAFGDRRSHQMDPANAREALREVEEDIAEGADIVMVKPALPYLDIVAHVKDRFGYPTAPARRRRYHHHVLRARGGPRHRLTAPARRRTQAVLLDGRAPAGVRARARSDRLRCASADHEPCSAAPGRSSPEAWTVPFARSRPSAPRRCSSGARGAPASRTWTATSSSTTSCPGARSFTATRPGGS
jgi:porphobilinogen synthase